MLEGRLVTTPSDVNTSFEYETRNEPFHCIPGIKHEVLLRMDFLLEMDLHINFNSGHVFYHNRIVSVLADQSTVTNLDILHAENP